MISARQQRFLWRSIVAASREADELVDVGAVADWARRAVGLLDEHEIDLTGAAQHERSRDVRALQGWLRTYRGTLAARGWLDSSDVARRLLAGRIAVPPSAVRLLDCTELPPLQRRCLARFARDGWRLAEIALPSERSAAARRVGAAQVALELEHAVAWSRALAAAGSGRLVALVVPPGYAPAGMLERLLGDGADTAFAAGRPALGVPAVAAALDALTLLSSEGGALELSRWLRSPFFEPAAPGAGGAAAQLEASLRDDLISQLSLPTAYRDGGLAQRLRAQVPARAAGLGRALEQLGDLDQARSPSRWTELWRGCLRELEWLASGGRARAHAIRVLDTALAEFARLTAVAPRLPLDEALAELRSVLAEPLLLPRMPVEGVHVLDHIDAVGPGYAGVWAVGFSDAAWPERRAPNPLLPHALQVRHGLPWSSPDDALARSKRSIARVCGIAPEVRLSWAEHDREGPRRASPLIAALAPVAASTARRMAGSRPKAAVVVVASDPVPPLDEVRIPGGAGALNQQARCPLRAFVERRLGARPLAPWSRGVTARLRGNIVHAAAEQLLGAGTTRDALAGWTPTMLARRIDFAAARALDRAFGRLRVQLQVIHTLERERLGRVLERLVDAELARGEFEVVATESKAVITLAGHEVHVRLDRVDRLGRGGVAIVDYKTGSATGAPDWFGAPIGDVQVPLYAAHVGAELTAAVLCQINPGSARYRGYWPDDDAFPGLAEKLPEALSWPQMRARWHAALEELVRAFAAGDARIGLDDTSFAEGPFAPLTRVHELREAPHGSDR